MRDCLVRRTCSASASIVYASVSLRIFFFQAEDGIRDYKVTGVQTCALPIYVLHGRKRFISGSPFADFAVLMASTAPEGSPQREISAFFVDLHAPGVQVVSGYKTMAGQSSTGDIVLDGCRVPAAQLIGEPGRGLAPALGRITVNPLLHCPAMLGLAQRSEEHTPELQSPCNLVCRLL